MIAPSTSIDTNEKFTYPVSMRVHGLASVPSCCCDGMKLLSCKLAEKDFPHSCTSNIRRKHLSEQFHLTSQLLLDVWVVCYNYVGRLKLQALNNHHSSDDVLSQICLQFQTSNPSHQYNAPLTLSQKSANMPLVHIVLFEFKPTVERSVIQDVCQHLPLNQRGAIAGS